jgi:hypothetical protein
MKNFSFVNKLILINFFLVFITFLFPVKANAANMKDLKKDMIFYSGKLTTLANDVFELEDRVLFIYQDFTLESDYLFLDFQNGHIKAKGNVRAINGDNQVMANELEVDILLESVKISGALVNLNNLMNFEAKDIFLMKKYISINGFRFHDEDKKLPFSYTVLLDKLNIFPFPGNNWFFLQVKDINGGLFSWDRLSPVDIPGWDFFFRNPNLPRQYLYQRRVRGFADPGNFFTRFGADLYHGPWAAVTVSYFGTDYSSGFFTTEYGLFSSAAFSVYQDLTDKRGNFIQFSSSLSLYDRYLQTANLEGNLNFIHDWEYDTLVMQLGVNQTFGPLVIHRLPTFSWNSIFRKEPVTGLQYRYDFDVTRFVTIEPGSNAQDVVRLKMLGDLNSPKFWVTPKISFQALSEGVYANYLNKSSQYAVAGQVQMQHSVFENLDYILRYRQRFVWGTSPLIFENLAVNQLAGLQVNWLITKNIELDGFTEFSIPFRQFSTVDLLLNYNTDYYAISFLFDILSLNVSANFKFLNF